MNYEHLVQELLRTKLSRSFRQSFYFLLCSCHRNTRMIKGYYNSVQNFPLLSENRHLNCVLFDVTDMLLPLVTVVLTGCFPFDLSLAR